MTEPFTCDTRFRFLLRSFGASEIALIGRFSHFSTLSIGGNSNTFNEGPGGFLSLSNPFTINSTDAWTVNVFIKPLKFASFTQVCY